MIGYDFERDCLNFETKHGDNVIKANGVWLSQREIDQRKANALQRGNIMLRRLGVMK